MNKIVSAQGFWAKLEKPIIALAPVADITDATFRYMIASRGKPDVVFTEFVSVDGLCSDGREHLVENLQYDEIERPIVAQFFGSDPEKFQQCAHLARELAFDGIDINMGCPVKMICKQGAGSSLIRNPELAQEIVQATIEAAGDLPVSVKTRIGYNKIESESWTQALLESGPAAITFHFRTRKEMYKPGAHWEVAKGIVEQAKGYETLIIGNGDITNVEDAVQVAGETGVDGVMIGRAVFGNPWFFNRERAGDDITMEERFEAMLEHARLYDTRFRGKKTFIGMRKHLMAYASGFRGSKEFRVLLQHVRDINDVEEAAETFRKRFESEIE